MNVEKDFVISPPLSPEEHQFILYAFKVADEKGYSYREIEFLMEDFVNHLENNTDLETRKINDLEGLNQYAEDIVNSIYTKKVRIPLLKDDDETVETIITTVEQHTDDARLILKFNADKKYFTDE